MTASYITRARVRDSAGNVLAILPTWSDGAIIADARSDLRVECGEWLGAACADAPEPTHQSAQELLSELEDA
jgi:hypothetical protein